MEIEELSKSQIILLTLLVSFITSIATGIVTVSLMDQAPPIIAQTVNRVIERTVETVVPKGQTASTVVTQEKTVIVKETDLISQAVKKVPPSSASTQAPQSRPRFWASASYSTPGAVVPTPPRSVTPPTRHRTFRRFACSRVCDTSRCRERLRVFGRDNDSRRDPDVDAGDRIIGPCGIGRGGRGAIRQIGCAHRFRHSDSYAVVVRHGYRCIR